MNIREEGLLMMIFGALIVSGFFLFAAVACKEFPSLECDDNRTPQCQNNGVVM